MKILFDTNIILDVLLDREPFVENASFLLSKVERAEIIGIACATTFTTIFYILEKSLGTKEASIHINSLLSLFVIAPVNRVVLESAAKLGFSDFEDAVLHESALNAGAEYIVTRNIVDFKKAKVPVFEPQELIRMLELLGNSH